MRYLVVFKATSIKHDHSCIICLSFCWRQTLFHDLCQMRIVMITTTSITMKMHWCYFLAVKYKRAVTHLQIKRHLQPIMTEIYIYRTHISQSCCGKADYNRVFSLRAPPASLLWPSSSLLEMPRRNRAILHDDKDFRERRKRRERRDEEAQNNETRWAWSQPESRRSPQACARHVWCLSFLPSQCTWGEDPSPGFTLTLSDALIQRWNNRTHPDAL